MAKRTALPTSMMPIGVKSRSAKRYLPVNASTTCGPWPSFIPPLSSIMRIGMALRTRPVQVIQPFCDSVMPLG